MVTSRQWILTDSPKNFWVDEWKITSSELGIKGKSFSISKTTLRAGLTEGVDAIEVNNGDFNFTILPTRGMSIWRGSYCGLGLGWESPIAGPVHPKFVDLLDHSGLGWLKGFDEWIVRCGLGSNGAPCSDMVPDNNGNPCKVFLNLHGKIANIPAHYVEVQVQLEEPHTITVTGHVNESMLFSPRLQLQTRIKTWPNSNQVLIEDSVVNKGATTAEFELLYHCNFGPPFLEAGSQLVAPLKTVHPRDAQAVKNIASFADYSGPKAGFIEQVYWLETNNNENGDTLAMLKSADSEKAVAIRFNCNQLPFLTLWKNTAALEDGYVTGIEPGTDYPNSRPFERAKGRLAILDPGKSFDCQIGIEVCANASATAQLEKEVREISQEPIQVNKSPHPDLSSEGLQN